MLKRWALIHFFKRWQCLIFRINIIKDSWVMLDPVCFINKIVFVFFSCGKIIFIDFPGGILKTLLKYYLIFLNIFIKFGSNVRIRCCFLCMMQPLGKIFIKIIKLLIINALILLNCLIYQILLNITVLLFHFNIIYW